MPSGYRMSVARISMRGWADYFPATTIKYQHWLPKQGGISLTTLTSGAAIALNPYASDVYMNSIYDVPRAVAITSTNTLASSVVTAHANELFYVTGHTSATSSKQWAASGGGGSIRGRCWNGALDYKNSYPSATTYLSQCGDFAATTSSATNPMCNNAALYQSTDYSTAAISSWNGLYPPTLVPANPAYVGSIGCGATASLTTDLKIATAPAVTSLTNKYGYASCAYSFQYTDGHKCGAASSNLVGCACSNTDYVTLDRTNAVGTAGLCFVGPAAATELRLLTLRKQSTGAIFAWPSGVTTASTDQSYVPSLVITDYAISTDGSFTYGMKGLSAFTSTSSTATEIANSNAGVAYSTADFRNCAGKTKSDLTFDSTSYVFWVEYGATDGYAIARSDYTSGTFVTPVPVWKQGVTTGGTQFSDNLIVGIAFADNGGTKTDSKDILYAASTTRIYATTTHYKAAASIVWYEIVVIGAGDANIFGGGYPGKFLNGDSFMGSEHRGISTTPSSYCNSDASVFRALEEEAKEEQAE